ncbi:MAG: (d)CMP kinase [Planctomycetales bacterium]
MIVTIDGPAGAGKSSAARALAERLGFRFLDTGALYRAVTYAAMSRGIDLADQDGLAELARALKIQLSEHEVFLDGEDIGELIRTSDVTLQSRYAADNPLVRETLNLFQRNAVAGGNFVTEGRDQGTVVFPDAACKIFLTASAEERAKRRLAEMTLRGELTSYEDVLAKQNERDLRDTLRPCGPLIQAQDAIELSTDGMSPADVVNHLEYLVRQKLSPKSSAGGDV